MFRFHYKYTDHLKYFAELAGMLQVPVHNNTFFLPPHIGTGYVRVTELANGLQVLINEVTINEDVHFIRDVSAQNSYTLRFDEITGIDNLTLDMGGNILKESRLAYSGAFLTNSLCELAYTASAGTQDRCVNIYFTEPWLEKNFGIKSTDEILSKYLSLKTAVFNFEVLNLEYRQLMEDIFVIKSEYPMQKVIQQNRVMLLLEKFFKSLYKKIDGSAKTNVTAEDTLKRIMQIESLLVKDLSQSPPTIPLLARKAMMSETKLKNVFKEVYGYNIYEYYQKNRMLKARQLLLSHRYSIKEIGLMLGFQNLSNFSIAYKKEFNILPSDVQTGVSFVLPQIN